MNIDEAKTFIDEMSYEQRVIGILDERTPVDGLAKVVNPDVARQVLDFLHADHLAALKEVDQQLGNLLATILGDGGHYYAKYGIAKSVKDAQGKYCALLVDVEDLKDALKEKEEEHTEEMRILNELRESLMGDNERLKKETEKLRAALQSIKIWCEGSTCEICGKKEMTDTDCYDYVMKALKWSKRGRRPTFLLADGRVYGGKEEVKDGQE